MARNYEVKYGTIKKNLLKDIEKKRKDYIDLESPIVQRFGGDVWATGRASMVYVIPEDKFDLPYEIKEDRASEMKSILLKVSGVDKYYLDFDCVTSSRNFKNFLTSVAFKCTNLFNFPTTWNFNKFLKFLELVTQSKSK